MRTIALALSVGVACGGAAGTTTPGWRPAVWTGGPRDQGAVPIVLPIAPGTSGTELIVKVLAGARAADAQGISDFSIQLGHCVREISFAPALAATPTRDRELDPIAFVADDTDYVCARAVDLHLTGDGTNGSGHFGLHDTEMVEHDDCKHVPVRRAVTRYRVDVEHGFAPPDWVQIATWTGIRLAAGTPHCDAADDRAELRMVLHARPRGSSPVERPPSVPSVAEIVRDGVERARAASRRGDPIDASTQAERALAAWTPAVDAPELLAEAHYLAVEADVAAFLARPAPPAADAAWAAELGRELDRIAARYEQIGDAVRMPAATPWLHAGATRLAALHVHVAELLEAVGQHASSLRQREIARKLAAVAS